MCIRPNASISAKSINLTPGIDNERRGLVKTAGVGFLAGMSGTLSHFANGADSSVSDIVARLDWINVEDYGTVGDGVTNDTQAIQDALRAVPDTGGVVYFPPGSYKLEGYPRVNNSTTILGFGRAKIVDGGFHLKSRNIFIDGLVFEWKSVNTSIVPNAVYLNQDNELLENRIGNISLCNNLFIDTIISFSLKEETASEISVTNIRINNNDFQGDFTKSLNLISAKGVEGLWITDNNFDVSGLLRLGKISARKRDGVKPSEGVYIQRNRIKAEPIKQLFDFYNGAQKLIITDNVIQSQTKMSTVFEQKSGGEYDSNNPCHTKEILISNNIVNASFSQFVIMRGCYEKCDTVDASECRDEYSTVTVANNEVVCRRDESDKGGLIQVTNVNSALVQGNHLAFGNGGNTYDAIGIGAVESALVKGNVVQKGSIIIGGREVVIEGNILNNYLDYGGLYLFEPRGGYVIVTNNIFKTEKTNRPRGHIYVLSPSEIGSIDTLIVANNIGVTPVASEDQMTIRGVTVVNLIEVNNSWNS